MERWKGGRNGGSGMCVLAYVYVPEREKRWRRGRGNTLDHSLKCVHAMYPSIPASMSACVRTCTTGRHGSSWKYHAPEPELVLRLNLFLCLADAHGR